MPGGTLSIAMRTGTRCARRTTGIDRIGIGQSLRAGSGIRHADAARHRGDMAEDGLRITHQLRLDAIADADPRQFGFFEVPVDPIAVGVDNRDIDTALMGVVADPHLQVRYIAVDRAANPGSAQIDLRLCFLLLGGFEGGFGLHRGARKDLLLLWGGREIRKALPPLGLYFFDLQISSPLLDLRFGDAQRDLDRKNVV